MADNEPCQTSADRCHVHGQVAAEPRRDALGASTVAIEAVKYQFMGLLSCKNTVLGLAERGMGVIRLGWCRRHTARM